MCEAGLKKIEFFPLLSNEILARAQTPLLECYFFRYL